MTLLEENEDRGVLWCQLSCDLAHQRLEELGLQGEGGDTVGVAASILDNIVSDYETYGFRSVPEKYSQFFFDDAPAESGDDAPPSRMQTSDDNDCVASTSGNQQLPDDCRARRSSTADSPVRADAAASVRPSAAQSSGASGVASREEIRMWKTKQRTKQFLSDSAGPVDGAGPPADVWLDRAQTVSSLENFERSFLSDSASHVDAGVSGCAVDKAKILLALKQHVPAPFMQATQRKRNTLSKTQ